MLLIILGVIFAILTSVAVHFTVFKTKKAVNALTQPSEVQKKPQNQTKEEELRKSERQELEKQESKEKLEESGQERLPRLTQEEQLKSEQTHEHKRELEQQQTREPRREIESPKTRGANLRARHADTINFLENRRNANPVQRNDSIKEGLLTATAGCTKENQILLSLQCAKDKSQGIMQLCVMVIDASGSMCHRIEQVKEAAGKFIEQTTSSWMIGTIFFDHEIITPVTGFLQMDTDSKREQAKKIINTCQPRGGTNISAALYEAASMITAYGNENKNLHYLPSICLFSDGEPLGGDTNGTSVARELKRREVPFLRLHQFLFGDAGKFMIDLQKAFDDSFPVMHSSNVRSEEFLDGLNLFKFTEENRRITNIKVTVTPKPNIDVVNVRDTIDLGSLDVGQEVTRCITFVIPQNDSVDDVADILVMFTEHSSQGTLQKQLQLVVFKDGSTPSDVIEEKACSHKIREVAGQAILSASDKLVAETNMISTSEICFDLEKAEQEVDRIHQYFQGITEKRKYSETVGVANDALNQSKIVINSCPRKEAGVTLNILGTGLKHQKLICASKIETNFATQTQVEGLSAKMRNAFIAQRRQATGSDADALRSADCSAAVSAQITRGVSLRKVNTKK